MGAFNFNQQELERIKADAEAFYEKLPDIFCPYF